MLRSLQNFGAIGKKTEVRLKKPGNKIDCVPKFGMN